MSRPLGSVLLLLALWVQVLAPAAALRAVTARGDPFAGMPICGHGPAGSADEASDADPPAAGTAPCGLCCLAVAVREPTPPDVAAVALAWTVLAFTAPPGGSVRPIALSVARARDPPARV